VPVGLVLDTDIGSDVDDAIALVLAALDPRLDLLAVTTVNGDTTLRARIARSLLRMLGRAGIPVGAGAGTGLSGQPHPFMPAMAGFEGDGLELVDELFAPAHEVIRDALTGAVAPVDVCAIGAVTNVASVLATEPELCEQVRAVHVMGGCFGPVWMGDAARTPASPFAEFNLGCDPMAAAVLFGLPVAIRMVPIDVTMPLFFDDADRARLREGSVGRTIDQLAEPWLDFQRVRRPDQPEGLAKIRLHDPLTVLGIVDDAVETREDLRVSVFGSPGQVRTLETPQGRAVTVVRRADGRRLRNTLVETILAAG
jgi:purine nucleosidase